MSTVKTQARQLASSGGNQLPDSAHILKVKPRDFADELGLGYVRERGVRKWKSCHLLKQ